MTGSVGIAQHRSARKICKMLICEVALEPITKKALASGQQKHLQVASGLL